jgi:putative aldouronate transport system permease protein
MRNLRSDGSGLDFSHRKEAKKRMSQIQSTVKRSTLNSSALTPRKKPFKARLYEQRYLLLLSVPFVIWLIIFQYIPIWGWTVAFQNYRLGRTFFEQDWVGLRFFVEAFMDPRFWNAFRNTLAMSVLNIAVGFTLPIFLALLLNEMKNLPFKRTVQTISYLPHFVSWVVVASMVIQVLSTEDGIVNIVLQRVGLIEQPIQFMAIPEIFWFIVTGASAWKETGWGAIIYLAAIAGVDQELYDAATVDGCGRWRKMWYVTLPGISSTIVVLFIMAIGNLTRIGFERQLLLGNALVVDYAEVIDLYILKYGIGLGRYSFGTAIGMFNSIVAVILLVTANSVARRGTLLWGTYVGSWCQKHTKRSRVPRLSDRGYADHMRSHALSFPQRPCALVE